MAHAGQDAEVGHRMRTSALVLGGRLVIFSLVLALAVPAGGWGHTWLPYVVALAFFATIPLALNLRRELRSHAWLPGVFAIDVLIVTALVTLTGGVTSPLSFLLPLVLVAAGLCAEPRQVVRVSLLALLSHLVVGMLELNQWLKGAIPLSGQGLLVIVAIQLAILALTAVLTHSMSLHRAHAREREARLAEGHRDFLREWPLAFLFLDEAGRILLANQLACEILGHATPQALVGNDFASLLDPEEPTELPDERTRSERCLIRKDGTKVMCDVETWRVRWPPAIPTPAGAELRDGAARLVSITSTTGAFKGGRRPPTSADVAAEIAHEIRNPLAAISGCVQVLLDLERRARLGDTRSKALLETDRAALFESIVAETGRLDRILEKFIDYAEFSAARLAVVLNWDDHGRQPDTPLRVPEKRDAGPS